MLKHKLLTRFGPSPAGLSEKEQMRIALINMRCKDEDGQVHFIDVDADAVDRNRLAIGGAGAALHHDNLKAAGITHIVCLCNQVRSMFPESFQYLRVDNFDDDGSERSIEVLEGHLDKCLSFMHEAITGGQNCSVMVHCFQGKSRSAAVCCSYLMKYHPKRAPDFDSALALVRQTRPQACPNMMLTTFIRKWGMGSENSINNSKKEEIEEESTPMTVFDTLEIKKEI